MIFMLISLGWRLLQILSPIHVFRVVRTLSVMLFSLLHPLKRKRNRRTDNGTPASPFSTNIRDAFIGNAYMVLSTIILPLQHCQAKVQKYFKQFRLTKKYATNNNKDRTFGVLSCSLHSLSPVFTQIRELVTPEKYTSSQGRTMRLLLVRHQTT